RTHDQARRVLARRPTTWLYVDRADAQPHGVVLRNGFGLSIRLDVSPRDHRWPLIRSDLERGLRLLRSLLPGARPGTCAATPLPRLHRLVATARLAASRNLLARDTRRFSIANAARQAAP